MYTKSHTYRLKVKIKWRSKELEDLKKSHLQDLLAEIEDMKKKSTELDEKALKKLYLDFCETYGKICELIKHPCKTMLDCQNFMRELIAKLFCSRPHFSIK